MRRVYRSLPSPVASGALGPLSNAVVRALAAFVVGQAYANICIGRPTDIFPLANRDIDYEDYFQQAPHDDEESHVPQIDEEEEAQIVHIADMDFATITQTQNL